MDKCGFPGDQSTEMKVKAGPSIQTVTATNVVYRPQGPVDPNNIDAGIVYSDEAEYDACYLEITLDETVL